MLEKDGRQYRNLEEQVLKNQEDIRYLLYEGGTLNQFGIKVVGTVTSVSLLPDPTTYQGEYGDAFAVGTEAPFSFYIFTRAISGQPDPYWFALGEFPVPGPQGEQGATGATGPMGPQGPQGVQGLQGNTGPIGPIGPQGATGPAGPEGPIGPKGDPGQSFSLGGILTDENQLPPPTQEIRNYAYLIGTAAPYDLYMITGEEELIWENTGPFGGVAGPQGPQGDPGPQGETGPAGPQGPQGDPGPQGVQGIQGVQGNPGENGITPHIGTNGNWFIGSTDTNIKAENRTYFGVCSSAASASLKQVAITGFANPTVGSKVAIRFRVANTVNSPVLSINNGNSIPIEADGDTVYVKWPANSVMELIYDGTNWVVLSGYKLTGHPIGDRQSQFEGQPAPGELYGGAWTIDTDMTGRVMIGSGTTSGDAYVIGEQGGSPTVAHSHTQLPDDTERLYACIGPSDQDLKVKYVQDVPAFAAYISYGATYRQDGTYPNQTYGIEVLGSTATITFSIMQPYKVVTWWKRTA